MQRVICFQASWSGDVPLNFVTLHIPPSLPVQRSLTGEKFHTRSYLSITFGKSLVIRW